MANQDKIKRKSIKRLYDGGTPSLKGTIIKILSLGVLDAVTVFVLFILFMRQNWIGVAVGAVAMVILNWLYLRRGGLPAKYLAPGVVFLIAFQIYVLFFSAYTAFTNYGSFHNGEQRLAITAIQAASFGQVEGSAQYDVKPVQAKNGDVNLLLTDAINGQVMIAGPNTPLQEVPECTAAIKEVIATNASTSTDCQVEIVAEKIGTAISTAEYAPFDLSTLNSKAQNKLGQTRFYLDPDNLDGQFVMSEDLTVAQVYQPELKWDEKSKSFTRVTDGVVFKAAEDGFFRADGVIDGERLEIGWRVEIGLKNFETIFGDEKLRLPLLKIISWTFIFAGASVLSTFVVGLAIALLFNDERIRGKKIYRSLMILPYAFPAFLSAYVWKGLYNTDNGFINNVILGGWIHDVVLGGNNIAWLAEEGPARAAILLTNLWLGFPYMFLITTGALQAIPSELTESATIDGATPWQILRQIKLPLLLVSIAPLLISSFAFNFNNFTLIYLLTKGGPVADTTSNYEAGGTDILITFVYKIAFSGSHGQDYGLASAFSILIFLVVGTLSMISFRRTRTLEDVN